MLLKSFLIRASHVSSSFHEGHPYFEHLLVINNGDSLFKDGLEHFHVAVSAQGLWIAFFSSSFYPSSHWFLGEGVIFVAVGVSSVVPVSPCNEGIVGRYASKLALTCSFVMFCSFSCSHLWLRILLIAEWWRDWRQLPFFVEVPGFTAPL